ncbi:hypothetical protein KSF_106760 [Reticulibacter mediterranei]|uniref:Uncharacterized protein n=1 Tax=Reticulibacter mediterranei TaxID=2778369 RepID=A0A8J3N9C8_9CHLR|nr:hypothetical protein [Reticulibacter mediterranei]GHP00629.1 hypothetical protein KSF_106760 [Reticulibacter mediterranei]
MVRPPQLYLHHIGIEGFDTDAPKTLYNTQNIESICCVLDDEHREQTHAVLHRLFPGGQCYCWGVPEKAPVLGNLTAGDYVLLMRTTRVGGEIPVLGWVKYVLPVQSPELSRVLWGKDKYPLIFMFEAERISLTWDEFRLHMGYSDRYDPHGRFQSVRPKKLMEHYGGAKGYIAFVRKHYAVGALRFPQRQIEIEEIAGQEHSAGFLSTDTPITSLPSGRPYSHDPLATHTSFVEPSLWLPDAGRTA